MSAYRKETLDKLENELNHPSTFLKQMLASSKTGMISLSIIQQMSGELCNIPLDYIIHCIKKDDRFAFDPFQVKVCLRSQLKTRLTKTTPYGTIDPDDDEDEYDNQVNQDKEKEKAVVLYPEHKTPFFRPMFSNIEKVFPIFFDNDTFYVDDLPENQVNPEEPNVAVPEFDLYDIKPLTNDEDTLAIGQEVPRGLVECFNCGSPDHKFTECPQPTDLKRIKSKRRQVASKEKFDRLYKELEIRNRVNTFVPGEISATLRDALGMNEVEEPPYYRKMRIHGYPPGYVIDVDPSKPVPTFQSLNERNFKLDMEELKVYDDAYMMDRKEEEEEDDNKKVELEPRDKKTVKMKLVDYGVDFDELKPEPEPEKKEVAFDGLEAAMQRYNFAQSETNSNDNNNTSSNNHYYQQQQQQQTENAYQPEYSYQNPQDPYSYYYGYYDYSAYQQYNDYQPPPPPPPPSASEPPPPASAPPPPPPPPPAPLSQTIHPDPSNYPPPTIQNHTTPQINTSQPDNDDNDSVDMEISDDDDDS